MRNLQPPCLLFEAIVDIPNSFVAEASLLRPNSVDTSYQILWKDERYSPILYEGFFTWLWFMFVFCNDIESVLIFLPSKQRRPGAYPQLLQDLGISGVPAACARDFVWFCGILWYQYRYSYIIYMVLVIQHGKQENQPLIIFLLIFNGDSSCLMLLQAVYRYHKQGFAVSCCLKTSPATILIHWLSAESGNGAVRLPMRRKNCMSFLQTIIIPITTHHIQEWIQYIYIYI